MPESLQQKVDRMTAGMEVTVAFGGTRPGTVTGPVTSEGGVLFVVGRPVRFNDGRVNPFITAIDMPDPACPYSDGDAVLIVTGTRAGMTANVTGRMVWCDDHEAWEVEVRFEGGLDQYVPEDLTLVPPDPAPFKPGDKVRWNAETRALNGGDENRQTVDSCEQRQGQWRVNYAHRTQGWDWAHDLELVPVPDCPAILVTYTSGNRKQPEVQARRQTLDGTVYYGHSTLGWWVDHHESTEYGVAAVQALHPTEYLRGGA